LAKSGAGDAHAVAVFAQQRWAAPTALATRIASPVGAWQQLRAAPTTSATRMH
jgi:ApbE superfamily uncharacterized protein (UPF0280 family)